MPHYKSTTNVILNMMLCYNSENGYFYKYCYNVKHISPNGSCYIPNWSSWSKEFNGTNIVVIWAIIQGQMQYLHYLHYCSYHCSYDYNVGTIEFLGSRAFIWYIGWPIWTNRFDMVAMKLSLNECDLLIFWE